MAYQNVGTPRFYVNILEYLGAIGYTEIEDVYRTNPTSIKPVTEVITTTVPEGIFGEKSFVAFLGHSGGQLNCTEYSSDISVNANIGSELDSLDPEHEGFSIASFNGIDIEGEIQTYHENEIGSIVVGSYYDMPHSPDLNLKLSYEYDGVKTVQSKGGATLSNASYTKPADWGNTGAWQLGDIDGQGISNIRSGRRSWSLSFSFLNDTDVFPVNATTSNPLNTSPTDDTLLNGTDFFTQVWNRTVGLPFIFQPNGGGGVAGEGNFNPDQFCIARFDQSSLQLTQTSPNLYSISLKIRESW